MILAGERSTLLLLGFLALLLTQPWTGREEQGRRLLLEGEAATLDPNRASPEQLLGLPGMSQAIAEAWVAQRAGRILFGPRDLLAIPGVGSGEVLRWTPFLDFGPGAAWQPEAWSPEVRGSPGTWPGGPAGGQPSWLPTTPELLAASRSEEASRADLGAP